MDAKRENAVHDFEGSEDRNEALRQNETRRKDLEMSMNVWLLRAEAFAACHDVGVLSLHA